MKAFEDDRARSGRQRQYRSGQCPRLWDQLAHRPIFRCERHHRDCDERGGAKGVDGWGGYARRSAREASVAGDV